MKLREFFYFDRETLETLDDKGYDPSFDQSITQKKDTRKTRLTLSQINKVRRASELHTENKGKELEFLRQMYGINANAELGA
jgi:hypothetical protein